MREGIQPCQSPASPGRVVVVLGSAGSLVPLKRILGALPSTLDAAVIVLMHRSAHRSSTLTRLLSRCCQLPVVDATQGQPLVKGVVYVMPPGDVDVSIASNAAGDTLHFDPSPQMTWHRGGDRLLRAAAAAFGSRVIGIVLSGMGRNGETGLAAVARTGGATLVQDPAEAEYHSMPAHALEVVTPDFCGPAVELGKRVVLLCRPLPASATG